MAFADLIGNRNAAGILMRLGASGAVPGSLLFSGPEGVGKKNFAVEFARTLLCPKTLDGEACGACSSCVRVGAFNIPTSDKTDDYKTVFLSKHPDVGMVTTPKRIIPVDAIRALEREANIRPFEGSRRVFLIDDAEKMNDSSANALLKTLEEPPATTNLILITSRPDRLLPTIRSRVQTVRFAPVAAGEIAEFLRSKGTDPQAASLAADASGGSPALALAFDAEVYTEALSLLSGLLNEVAGGGDSARALTISETLNDARNKDRYEENLSMLQSMLRDALAIRLGFAAENSAGKTSSPVLDNFAARIETSTLTAWIDDIDVLLQNLLVNINRRIATDALFTKMAA